MGRFFFILVAIVCFCVNTSTVYSASVAVMPFDDLSKGKNSVDFGLTDYFSDRLEERGVALVSKADMILFLKKNRIRNLGYLESKNILSAKESMGADFILLGSVCQNRQDTAALGVTLSLVRTTDAKTVWSNAEGVSLPDTQKILGLFAPRTHDELLPILCDNLLSDWPNNLQDIAEYDASGNVLPKELEAAPIEIDSVLFSPANVRPGEKVKCTVLFRPMLAKNKTPQIFLKVGSRVHLAKSDDGNFYQASWIGSSGENPEEMQMAIGNSIQLAAKEIPPSLYEEIWSSAEQDADYPVSLIVDWPSGKREESFLGSYTVDSLPPEVVIKPQGKNVDGIVAFNNNLLIYVGIVKPEPIARWQLAINDAKGDEILVSQGTGSVPDKFVWRGTNKRNFHVEDGRYTISVQVWDRAGNAGSSSQEVLYSKNISALTLDGQQQDNALSVAIDTDHLLPLRHWSVEMWSVDNRLLQKVVGDTLPSTISIPYSAQELQDKKVSLAIAVEDILGNKSKKRVDNLYHIVFQAGDEFAEDTPEDDVSEFENTWHDDF